MDTNKIFTRLSEILDVKTDSALAENLGLSRQSIANSRNRETVPFEKIAELAELKGFSLDYLLLGKQETVALDLETLVKTIELVQKIKKLKKLELSSKREAKAIGLLYRIFQSEQEVDEETVIEFMDMAAG